MEKSNAQKLQIKENDNVLVINAPEDYIRLLGELAPKAALLNKASEPADVVLFFAASRKELEAQLPDLKTTLKPKGILWVSYPKSTSGIKADINRDSIREYGKTIRLEAVALVALDDTWSALRLKAV